MRTRGLLGDDKRPEYPEVPDTTCSDCGKAAEIDAEEGVCRECYDRLAGVQPAHPLDWMHPDEPSAFAGVCTDCDGTGHFHGLPENGDCPPCHGLGHRSHIAESPVPTDTPEDPLQWPEIVDSVMVRRWPSGYSASITLPDVPGFVSERRWPTPQEALRDVLSQVSLAAPVPSEPLDVERLADAIHVVENHTHDQSEGLHHQPDGHHPLGLHQTLKAEAIAAEYARLAAPVPTDTPGADE